MDSSSTLQVSRRKAVKAVPVSTVSPPCCTSRIQCWVERLVRAARACTVNGPWASAAAKLMVSDTGSAQAVRVQQHRVHHLCGADAAKRPHHVGVGRAGVSGKAAVGLSLMATA